MALHDIMFIAIWLGVAGLSVVADSLSVVNTPKLRECATGWYVNFRLGAFSNMAMTITASTVWRAMLQKIL